MPKYIFRLMRLPRINSVVDEKSANAVNSRPPRPISSSPTGAN
jgi:hypothetical protein